TAVSTGDLPLDFRANSAQTDAQPIQNARRDAIVLSYKSQEQVLGRDVVLSKPSGLFLREEDHPPRAFRESLPHGSLTSGPERLRDTPIKPQRRPLHNMHKIHERAALCVLERIFHFILYSAQDEYQSS